MPTTLKSPQPGDIVDGFLIESFAHTGGMARIANVSYADGRESPFPLAMKIPRMAVGDGAENIVGFEVELQILRSLQGRHVPRFVSAGDIETLPYLVMEFVQGYSLQSFLEELGHNNQRPSPEQVAQKGVAMARAANSLHQQNVCHLDLKPGNVLFRLDGSAVLLDFGLSYHALYPDLMAEELRKAVGSPAWISPEQIVGVRGDPRSDVFAIGVMLYELATGEMPFGYPSTDSGMRQRMWMAPVSPRAIRSDIPEWLQEIILRCLAPMAEDRYPSASHLAFDLSHPDQIKITELGTSLHKPGVWKTFKRFVRAAGMEYKPSPPPQRQAMDTPIIMVAVPHHDVTDATLFSLRESVKRSLQVRPGSRLAVVTVISSSLSSNTDINKSEINVHRQHMARIRQWADPLDLDVHHISFHVLEADDVADALLRYAEGNEVSLIVMGAATHGLALQRIKPTVPMKVAMAAPCTVVLVKQNIPFELLSTENRWEGGSDSGPV